MLTELTHEEFLNRYGDEFNKVGKGWINPFFNTTSESLYTIRLVCKTQLGITKIYYKYSSYGSVYSFIHTNRFILKIYKIGDNFLYLKHHNIRFMIWLNGQ